VVGRQWSATAATRPLEAVNTNPRRLAAVAFADIAGWSQLVGTDEVRSMLAWSALRSRLIEPKIAEHGGRLIDLAGDSVLVEFPSAVQAVQWALDIQQGLPAPAGDFERNLRLRVGISVGDLLVDGQRLVGDEVNIASRIHQLAAAGEVVVTEAVRHHVQHRIAVHFVDLGERTLKHIARPLRLFRAETEAPLSPMAEAVAVAAGPRTLLALRTSGVPGTNGDELRRLRELIPPGLIANGSAHELNAEGDRLLLEFPEVRAAVQTAFAIQRACREAAPRAQRPQTLPRIGLQSFASIQTARIAGGAADLAAWLAALAPPGSIVASAAVCNELTPTLDAEIEDLGDCCLREMNQPVRAFRLEPPDRPSGVESLLRSDDLRPTIAVIPFAEHGSGHDVVGEIIADEVIAALSKSAEVNVVSRLSTTAFRRRKASLRDLGTHLNANYVLSGAYRVAQDHVVLTAELAETSSGRVVWARELRGSVAGVVTGADEMIDRLVADASRALLARELERTQSQSLQTLASCSLLIGAVGLMHRLSLADFMRAREMLQALVRRLPRHAVPHAWLAKWHVLRVWQSWSDDPAADRLEALACGQRALDCDSHCSLALAIDGFVHTNLFKQLDIGQQRYELALQVNPNDALAWILSGTLHAFKGEGRQAVKHAHQGLRLSPLDPHRWFHESLAASAELAAGHHERAIALAQRSLKANRVHASTLRVLVVANWLAGRQEPAREAVAALLRVEPGITVSGWLERSPSSAYPIGQCFAQTLHAAGVPMHAA
jgi:adenylate cyclase